MKSHSAIIISGIIMIGSGFLLFYSIENVSNLDLLSKYTKHSGMFTGLLGIGVTIAGLLLRLMDREETKFQENLEN
ncbi:MAG: hypothetical protein ACE5DL_02855 [Nitrosopumilaceae archaeon]